MYSMLVEYGTPVHVCFFFRITEEEGHICYCGISTYFDIAPEIFLVHIK